MDNTYLINLIEDGESEKIEFKKKLDSTQAAAKTVSAFANTLGGRLLIGITDGKKIVGVTQIDKIQQKLSAAVQSISPRPTVNITSHKIQEQNVVVVNVQQASDNSYYTYNGAIYVRIGSTNQRLDGREQLEFIRNKQLLSFGEEVLDNVTTEDLSLEKIQSYLVDIGQKKYFDTRSIEDFLLNEQIAIKKDKFRIKNAAILLFGKYPTKFHAQSEIKLAKFKDTEAVDIQSTYITSNTLGGAIEEALQFIKENIKKSITVSEKATRLEDYEYPFVAIREVVVNAVVHRDYFSHDAIQINLFSDRMEIISPGGLPRGMSKELFGSYSIRRNPIIYRILRDMKYVEGFGTGIPRIKNAFRKAGLADPKFDISDWLFRVIFYNKKGSKSVIDSLSDLSPRQKKAVNYLYKHKAIKAATYAEINGISYQTAISDINEMIEFGYLQKIGSYKGAYYTLID